MGVQIEAIKELENYTKNQLLALQVLKRWQVNIKLPTVLSSVEKFYHRWQTLLSYIHIP